jgi:hypothetical protein
MTGVAGNFVPQLLKDLCIFSVELQYNFHEYLRALGRTGSGSVF